MTNKEVKMMLKNAYVLPTTQKEKRFIQRNEQRSLQLADIIKVEFRYIGVKSILTGIILTVLLLIAAQSEDTEAVWIIASFIPLSALLPMALLSRSERCGMDELEAASRFSLRFIRIVRMFILGLFSIVLLFVIGIVLRLTRTATTMEHVTLVVFPYLLSVYGAMLITRKWHGKENIFGVLAVCAFAGLLPFVIRPIKLSWQLPDGVILLVIALLLGAMVRECLLYVKESEDLSWNLC